MDCKKCSKRFHPVKRVPLLLECGHNLCRDCIGGPERGAKLFKCPCGESTSTLRQNFSLLECMQNCTCNETHDTPKPSTSDAFYSNIFSTQDNENDDFVHISLCQNHSSQITLYCKTHESFYCEECKLTDKCELISVAERLNMIWTSFKEKVVKYYDLVKKRDHYFKLRGTALNDMKLRLDFLENSMKTNKENAMFLDVEFAKCHPLFTGNEKIDDLSALLKQSLKTLSAPDIVIDQTTVGIILNNMFKVQDIGLVFLESLLGMNVNKLYMKTTVDGQDLFSQLYKDEEGNIWVGPFSEGKEEDGICIESPDLLELFLSSQLVRLTKKRDNGKFFHSDVNLLHSGDKKSLAIEYLKHALNLNRAKKSMEYFVKYGYTFIAAENRSMRTFISTNSIPLTHQIHHYLAYRVRPEYVFEDAMADEIIGIVKMKNDLLTEDYHEPGKLLLEANVCLVRGNIDSIKEEHQIGSEFFQKINTLMAARHVVYKCPF